MTLVAVEKQARFKRLRKHFEDPMTEVHLLFYQATLPVFTEFNLLFQRQEPSVYLLHGQMRSYVKKLMSKFVTTTAIKNADVCEVEYKDKQNQVADHKLNVGWTTRTTLNRLHEAGEISQYQVDNFHKAVRAFFVAAVDYAFKKLPFKEPVLEHSQFIDFQQKMDCDVNDALYFVYRFSHLLPYGDPKEQDKLSDEFLDYQLMEEKDIPRSIWEQAVSRVSEQEVYHRMDKMSKSNKPNHAKGSSRQQQPKVCPPGSKRKVPESQKLTAFFGQGRLDTPLSPEPGHADVPVEKAARIEFSPLLPYGDPKEQDELSDEFLDYQLMEEKGIPRSIWEQVVGRVSEQEVYHRMDKVWAPMATIKSPVTGMPKLPRLSKVAQLILTLPYSNADAERVFSMIGLNKTDTRNALALESLQYNIMAPFRENSPPGRV
ncbi:UNVERIFIED_CONTAM: hypothetical protein FKN15_046591 [Acipenser sinensis]